MKKKATDFNAKAEAEMTLERMLRMLENAREEEVERYSPTGLMFKNRIIMVLGEVNTQMMANIVAQLKHLETADPKKPITMLINSPGGSVVDGMAIFDIMREVKCPIHTVGNGFQASMGSILLAGGDERRMTENSQLLIHQIMGGNRSGTQHTDMEISAAHMAKLHESLKSVYVAFTGLNHKFWDIVGERDTILSAAQAKKMGFINGIVQPEKERGPYAEESARPSKLRNWINEMVHAKIATMDVSEVKEALACGQANEGEWGRYRPELVVRLAEFPEFWVEKRKQEAVLKAQPAAVANDDVSSEKPAAAVVKKPAAPQA